MKSTIEENSRTPPPVETFNSLGSKPDTTLKQLQKLARKSSLWVLLGFGVGQLIRLGGNIILAWLLFPGAFGMMATVNALIQGLTMFSDLGIVPSIIQNKRGEEPDFLCTAWVLQIIRSIGIALVACLLAGPIAHFSNEPELFWMIIAVSLTSIISGFNSTWLLVYSRRLMLGKVIILGLVVQSLTLMVTVILAWQWQSVWALVVGNFVGPSIALIISHTWLRGVPMRFVWKREIGHELIHFGRWIFISTALGFLASRADIFILGGLTTMSVVGFFSIAKNLSAIATEALSRLSSTVLLPVYSRLAERGQKMLIQEIYRTRVQLFILFLPPLWMLILFGDHIIEYLYDPRYHDAGWMLRVLAAGATANIVSSTMYPVLLAKGDSFRHMLKTVVRLFFQIMGMIIGSYFWGINGFIVGLALTDWLSYPFGVYLIYRYGVWLPFLDIIALGFSLLIIVISL